MNAAVRHLACLLLAAAFTSFAMASEEEDPPPPPPPPPVYVTTTHFRIYKNSFVQTSGEIRINVNPVADYTAIEPFVYSEFTFQIEQGDETPYSWTVWDAERDIYPGSGGFNPGENTIYIWITPDGNWNVSGTDSSSYFGATPPPRPIEDNASEGLQAALTGTLATLVANSTNLILGIIGFFVVFGLVKSFSKRSA